MKIAVCFFLLAFAYVNADVAKIGGAENQVLSGLQATSVVIKNTNMPKAIANNILTAVKDSYSRSKDAQAFAKLTVDIISYSYNQYYWSALYNTLAYTTSQTYYAEIVINGKDQLYLHAINKRC